MSESRWWEFYGIRYAMGTVVGALIVYLVFSQSAELKEILMIPEKPKDFGISHLALVGAYGLAYCYIASGPVLVMHMVRAHMWGSPKTQWSRSWILRRVVLLLVPLAVAGIYWHQWSANSPYKNFNTAVLAIFTFSILLQVIVLMLAFRRGAFRTIRFYKKLAERRYKDPSGEFVESYRHLREHGNSFMIVIAEFVLGLALFSIVRDQTAVSASNQISLCILAIIVWLGPAAAAWFLGQRLESSFVKGRRKKALTKRSRATG